MRIDRIELFHVAMPLLYPWKTAYGEDAEIHSILCRMDSGSVSAWGESAPLAAPCYSPEWGGGIFDVTKTWLAPKLLGIDIETGLQLQQRLAVFKGNPFAKAILDNTWWSLKSAVSGIPLHTLLGAERDLITVGADFGVMDSVDALLAAIDDASHHGFARVKLKYRPDWDESMLRRVRDAFPNETFHIDCNAGYRIVDTDMFKRLDDYDLAMIEQPLNHDDLLDHAELAANIKTPICLDESISSVQLAKQALRLNACGYVNIKPGRVGGITIAKVIHDICAEAGIPCWVGGMLESATGGAICTALATLPNFQYPADIFPSARYYDTDLGEVPIELTANTAGQPSIRAFNEIPKPDPDRLSRWCLQSHVIS
ncbi:MAG: o-succinylbenzoate synthase [Rhodopirellula sp.]|nr:o-succinylbenzoate synthase [Rhodopirellula sp.]|tara:strand:+ start:37778 stop:38887 length:1110 start_codon:yes stop_codon:yes gene_type:complete